MPRLHAGGQYFHCPFSLVIGQLRCTFFIGAPASFLCRIRVSVLMSAESPVREMSVMLSTITVVPAGIEVPVEPAHSMSGVTADAFLASMYARKADSMWARSAPLSCGSLFPHPERASITTSTTAPSGARRRWGSSRSRQGRWSVTSTAVRHRRCVALDR